MTPRAIASTSNLGQASPVTRNFSPLTRPVARRWQAFPARDLGLDGPGGAWAHGRPISDDARPQAQRLMGADRARFGEENSVRHHHLKREFRSRDQPLPNPGCGARAGLECRPEGERIALMDHRRAGPHGAQQRCRDGGRAKTQSAIASTLRRAPATPATRNSSPLTRPGAGRRRAALVGLVRVRFDLRWAAWRRPRLWPAGEGLRTENQALKPTGKKREEGRGVEKRTEGIGRQDKREDSSASLTAWKPKGFWLRSPGAFRSLISSQGQASVYSRVFR